MRVVMYAPGGADRGVGHTMRALALAEEGIDRGWEVVLAGSLSGPALDQARQLPALQLAGEMTPTELLTLAATADVLHLDAYDDELGAVCGAHPFVSSMADGEFGLRQADLIIDTSPSAPFRGSSIGRAAGGLTLLGPAYSPMRKRVRALRGAWAPKVGRRRSVLLVMGGTDPQGLTTPLVRLLSDIPDLDVAVVADATRHREVLRAWSSRSGSARVATFIDNLVLEASQHDLVVTAAGTSVWEFACAGIPMGLVCTVENQSDNYQTLVRAGAALGLTSATSQLGDFTSRLCSVLKNPGQLAALSQLASGLVDGDGCWRIASAWKSMLATSPASASPSKLHARRAIPADSDMLFEWRNDATTREMSRDSAVVRLPEHMRWFANAVRDAGRRLLVVEDAGTPVGTVRWDSHEDHGYERPWEVSITLAPNMRGNGMALDVLRAGEEWLMRTEGGALRLIAVIHESNAASARLFRRAGYLPDRREDECGFVRLSKSGGVRP